MGFWGGKWANELPPFEHDPKRAADALRQQEEADLNGEDEVYTSYLRDAWNWLDLVVVVAAVLDSLPLPSEVGGTSSLRVLRVLRPLRSLSGFPSLRRLVDALMKSLASIGNVAVLMVFLLFIFSILAVQLWGVEGQLHGRCRMTPFPVQYASAGNASAAAALMGLDPSSAGSGASFASERGALLLAAAYWAAAEGRPLATFSQGLAAERCSAASGTLSLGRAGLPALSAAELDWSAAELDYSKGRSQESSAWRTPQCGCSWPLLPAPGDDQIGAPLRLCSLDGRGATCPSGSWCGSDYDGRGNARFCGDRHMKRATYVDALDWGLTNFDHVPQSMIALFQCVTFEGWTRTMARVMDGYSSMAASIFFPLLLLTAGYMALNMIIPAMYCSYMQSKTAQADARQQAHLQKSFALLVAATRAQRRRYLLVLQKQLGHAVTEEDDRHHISMKQLRDTPECQSLNVHECNSLMGALALTAPRRDPGHGGENSPHSPRSPRRHDIANPASLNLAANPSARVAEAMFKQFMIGAYAINPSCDPACKAKSGHGSAGYSDPWFLDLDPEAVYNGHPFAWVASLPWPEYLWHHHLLYVRHERMERLVLNKWFGYICTSAVLLNVLVLSLYRYPQDPDEAVLLESLGAVLTFVFTIEMLIKIAGMNLCW
jgi:hypothetical protein